MAVLAILGIASFAVEAGKYVLNAEQRAKIAEELGEEMTAEFEDKLALEKVPAGSDDNGGDGSSDEGADEGANSDANAYNADLAKKMAKLEAANKKLAAEKEKAEKLASNRLNMINRLSDQPEDDKKSTPVSSASVKLDPTNDKFLFGLNKSYMAIDSSRPYNQRAFAAICAKVGIIIPTQSATAMDYDSLKADLGDYYRTRHQDRINSFLMKLPSLETIFPLNSGYQDQDVLVNMFMDEFSQADNTNSIFENVVKGGYKFEPEIIRMFDVMFAHTFSKLKELEKSWIGYLNKEGSDTMKWSFIEFILAETAKKLFNERELRRVGGKRVNPTLNVPGTAMGASDGLFTFIKRQIDAFKIKCFDDLGALTPSNISNYIYEATGRIPAVFRDSGSLCMYLPSKLITWYHKNNESLYGLVETYQPDIMYVKEYPSVKIVEIKNADNYGRIIWTLDGNIALFEDQPGEMTKFNIEQKDWTLKVWSNWKESVWAFFVGKKFDSANEQDFDHQMIFCNDIHYNPEFYVKMDADSTTPSVAEHTSIISVPNSQATVLTNIADAVVGQEIRVKCGSAANAIKIAVAGNFSLIPEAWEPAVGDVIVLMKRADGKFIEIERTNITSQAILFAADDTTPSVKGSTTFVTDENTAATAITNLDDAVAGVEYKIYGNGSTHASTIANADHFVLTAAMTLDAGSEIVLVKSKTDGKFYEISRG